MTIADRSRPDPRASSGVFLMSDAFWKKLIAIVLLGCLAGFTFSCGATSSNEQFFGKTVPPSLDVFRYVTGDEPESLDPPVSTGQPEARIYMALFDGLVDY